MVIVEIYRRCIKRPMDLIVSALALIALSPLLIFLALLVRVNLGSPIFFKQKRPGYKERIFTIYKFRTMTDHRDDNGDLLPDSIRLNKFGRILRATSLDELPELLNILKGDMSFVGPRPLTVEYLPFYTKEECLRHNVRPGLTGLAQANGRNNLRWEKRFEYDIEYVKNIRFSIDIAIIARTVVRVFKGSDITEPGVDCIVDFDIYRENQANSMEGKSG